MSHRTTLSDLIAAIAKNMTTAELAKAVVNIQIQQMIHDTRMAKGWAQKDLADKMGVKQSLVSRWESGDATPSMDKLKALAKIYNVSLDWLCNDGDRDETTKGKPRENNTKENGEGVVAEKEKINKHKLTIDAVVAIVILTLSVIYVIARNRQNENVNTQIEDMEQDKSAPEEGGFDFVW